MKIIALIIFTILGTTYAKDWWVNGNYYQIYPRSFKDSDGDGVGDLNGITENLQYIKDIGMTGAWLSPIFKSPMADFGYDISNYYEIQPEYGTMKDFENLLKKAKTVGLKIFLDFVPNHTSDEHDWFNKSVNRIEPYTDFYVWHDGKIVDGIRQPPSNWRSVFRFSAWEWSNIRQQYYLHQFAIKQPDLNYRNPKVVDAMKNVLLFWLNKGVDGFRIDALPYIFENGIDKNGNYNDEPLNPNCLNPSEMCYTLKDYTKDQPQNYDMVYQWRQFVDEYKEIYGGETKILMTEAYTSLENNFKFYGDGKHNGSHIPFNFEFLDKIKPNSSAADYSKTIDSWLNNMPKDVTANWVMGNHDNSRVASRLGENRADLINIMIQTLPGNAVTYYGEELALTDVFISWEDAVDPVACNSDPDHYFAFTRDPVRTPFQWDDSMNSGFSTANRTWLPVAPNYKEINVKQQLSAPVSHLKIFKSLTSLRQHPSFQNGTFIKKVVNEVIAYKRETPGSDSYVIVLNFGLKNELINLKRLFPNISDNASVVTSSIQSKYTEGQTVNLTKFLSESEVGIVLISKKKIDE